MAPLEQDLPTLQEQAFTLDQLVIAVAAEYVNFRLPGTITPSQYPQPCRWLQSVSQRPHLAATAFA
ncbi:hypothetical protein J4711_13770 [Staphylococcus epidermidis]|nr:hypothetical protein [Staphylococcus epidermidis]